MVLICIIVIVILYIGFLNKHDFGVEIKESQISQSGRGLYCKKDYKKGDPIIQYIGLKIGEQDDMEYVLCLDQICWDARHVEHPAKYSNDCYNSKFNCNAYFDYYNGKPFIIADKDINAGDEIFTHYGYNYWPIKRKD